MHFMPYFIRCTSTTFVQKCFSQPLMPETHVTCDVFQNINTEFGSKFIVEFSNNLVQLLQIRLICHILLASLVYMGKDSTLNTHFSKELVFPV